MVSSTQAARERGNQHPIRKVAVLLMVQGAAEVALGLVYGAFTLSALADGGLGRSLVPPDMFGVVAVLGPATLLAGGLKVAAGIRNHAYRNRTLGQVALASGTVTSFTCLCAPAALALLVYGLRVYARPGPWQP